MYIKQVYPQTPRRGLVSLRGRPHVVVLQLLRHAQQPGSVLVGEHGRHLAEHVALRVGEGGEPLRGGQAGQALRLPVLRVLWGGPTVA